MKTGNENLNIIEIPTYADLLDQMSRMVQPGIVLVTGVIHRQGERLCFQTALSLEALSSATKVDRPSSKGGAVSREDLEAAVNRPLMKDHAKNIAKYVGDAQKNMRPYILPTITLNVRNRVDVMVVSGNNPIALAVMLLPLGARMDITDGQHRVAGIEKVMPSLTSYRANGIGVMITFTENLAQVHQDFADCARTKPINDSILTVYDSRNPVNGMVKELITHVPLFHHTVDAAKKSISPRSVTVWTGNQIRVFLKWALQGSQSGDDVFIENAKKMLGDTGSAAYNKVFEQVTEYVSCLTENSAVLKALAGLAPESLNQIPAIREETQSLLMTGSGLAVLGYLFFMLMREKQKKPGLDAQAVSRSIASLDWSKSSELFKDNLRVNPERMQSGPKYVKSAGDRIWQAIGFGGEGNG